MAVLLLLVACGGGTTEAVAPTSTTGASTSSTTVKSAEERFIDAIGRRLDFDGGAGPEAALSLAQQVCETLDIAYSDNVDASIADQMAGVELDAALSSETDAEVVAITLAVGAEQLCPEHVEFVASYLQAHGLPHT